MAMICASNLDIGYIAGNKRRIIQKNLDFSAGEGEFIALLGPNGCGKSTLLKTIGGLLPPLSGSFRINGRELREIPLQQRARLFSLVLTDQINIKYITVFQMVAMGRHPYTTFSGKTSGDDRKIVMESLNAVNMTDFSDRFFHELSDGERQRVMIAKALAQDTPAIFLDEPTSFLDMPNRIETMLLLKKLTVNTGKFILISTHEIDLAIHLADKIWLMDKGKGMNAGSPDEMMKNGSIKSVFKSDDFGFDEETGRIIIF